MSILHELGTMQMHRDKQVYEDAANVAQTLSWNSCYSTIQWFKNDIRFVSGGARNTDAANSSDQQQQQQGGEATTAVQRRAVCITPGAKLVKSFMALSVSDVMWFTTYVAKAVAYMRSDIMLQERRRCSRMAQMPFVEANLLMSESSIIYRALQPLFRSAEDARLMSDVLRIASNDVAAAYASPSSSHSGSDKAGSQQGVGVVLHTLFLHASCRLLELASLLEEMEAIVAHMPPPPYVHPHPAALAQPVATVAAPAVGAPPASSSSSSSSSWGNHGGGGGWRRGSDISKGSGRHHHNHNHNSHRDKKGYDEQKSYRIPMFCGTDMSYAYAHPAN